MKRKPRRIVLRPSAPAPAPPVLRPAAPVIVLEDRRPPPPAASKPLGLRFIGRIRPDSPILPRLVTPPASDADAIEAQLVGALMSGRAVRVALFEEGRRKAIAGWLGEVTDRFAIVFTSRDRTRSRVVPLQFITQVVIEEEEHAT